MSLRAPRIAPAPELAPAHVRLLLAVRWQRRWTQQDVADALGVDRVTVSRWERGVHDPHPAWVALLRGLLASV